MSERVQGRLDSGFGRRSEPKDVLEGVDLRDRVAVVTGGYSGIGLETTRALAERGARVHVPVRSPGKAEETLSELRDLDGEIVTAPMDLADLDSVRKYARRVRNREVKLDLLINNAGVMACPETRVGNGWEMQLAVNHLAHHLLAMELLSLLEEADGPRVVALSSVGHKRSAIRWDDPHFHRDPYDKWEAYGQSKTADALFALGFDLSHADRGIRAFSVHPGGILTPLQRHMDTEEMVAMGWVNEDGTPSDRAQKMFKSPTQGASTTLWAATSPLLEGTGGLYCEDCDVADPWNPDDPDQDEEARYRGVAPWAVSAESARRLWDWTEETLARA